MNAQEFLARVSGGNLSHEDFARGMHLSYKNARQLLQDARTLRETSPGRALSLAVLAVEEFGKIILLCEGAIKAGLIGPVPWNEVRKELTSHASKQRALADYGTTLHRIEKPFFEEGLPSDVVLILDRMKQLGLYVDWTGKGFLSPAQFGDANVEWADWLIEIAKQRLDSVGQFHETEEASRAFLDHGIGFFQRMRQSMRDATPTDEDSLEEAVRAFMREEFAGPEDADPNEIPPKTD